MGNSILVLNAPEELLINGNSDIWQYEVNQVTGVSGYGSDDRFENINVGHTRTHDQGVFALGQTDVPGDLEFYSITAITAAGAGVSDECRKSQKIEGVKSLEGETATFEFWAKTDSAKDIAISFDQFFGSGGSPSAIVEGSGTTISLTTNWKRYFVTVSIPSISGKILGTGGNDYLQVHAWLSAGSDFDARTNTLGLQSGTFDISRMRVYKGNPTLLFRKRKASEELALCLRYFEKTYDLKVAPGTSTTIGRTQLRLTSASVFAAMVFFKVKKRAIPTIVTYHEDGTIGIWQRSGGTASTSIDELGEGSMNVNNTGTQDFIWRGHWTSKAEL